MMTTLEVNSIVKHDVLDDERSVAAGQSHVAVLVERIGQVRRTTVLEVFRLFPVDEIVIVETRVETVLEITRAVLTHKHVVVVDVVPECGWQTVVLALWSPDLTRGQRGQTVSCDRSISSLGKHGREHVRAESTASVERVAFQTTDLLEIDALEAVHVTPTATYAAEALLLIQHAVVVVGESIADDVVGETQAPDACLVQGRVCLTVVCAFIKSNKL